MSKNLVVTDNDKATLDHFLSRRGHIVRATWQRPMKTRKGVVHFLEKRVTMQLRVGVEYDNMKDVQEKRASGELPAVNAGLPWGKWATHPVTGESLYKYVIAHTPKGEEQECYYFRFYKFTDAANRRAHTEYFMDGKPTTKEEIQAMCLKSEFNEDSEMEECITVRQAYIQSIE